MKSPPPPETGPPDPGEESEPREQSPTKPPGPGQSEKDSGYSDSSSESVSSEGQGAGSQAACPPILILQGVVLEEPRLLLLQRPIRHRKSPSSYLPILRSYPRIAPRLAPPPAPRPALSPGPAPRLTEVSLRALALLRRSRDTQRAVRELRGHVRLYERALRGECGGWERLREAMDRSGVYRTPDTASDTNTGPATKPPAVTSSGGCVTSSESNDSTKEEAV